MNSTPNTSNNPLDQIEAFSGSFLFIKIQQIPSTEQIQEIIAVKPRAIIFQGSLSELPSLIKNTRALLPQSLPFGIQSTGEKLPCELLQTLGTKFIVGPFFNNIKRNSPAHGELLEYVDTLTHAGIACIPGNYPGIPHLVEDALSEHPVVEYDLKQLTSSELLSYQDLIAKNIPALLSSHALYPNIDTLYPASLSEEISSTILRDTYEFKGVLLSDDVNSDYVKSIYEKPYTIGRGFNAGCDGFIISISGSLKPSELAKRIVPSIKMEKTSVARVLQAHKRLERFCPCT